MPPFLPYILLGILGFVLGLFARFLIRVFSGVSSDASPFLKAISWGLPIAFAVLIPLYYYWEFIYCGNSFWTDFITFQGEENLSCDKDSSLWPRFYVHLFLFFIIIAASCVDFERYIIPDALMIPATVLGLIFMTVFPGAALPDYFFNEGSFFIQNRPLTAFPFPLTNSAMLGLTLLGILFWAFALLDRRWFPQLGWRRASLLFLRRLKESPLTIILPILALLLALGAWTLYRLPPFSQQGAMKWGLLSAVVGMVSGMILIWGVRLIGRLILGREAMGFGDVVYLGFIGIFVGWQGTILIFFLAPFAGLIFGIIRALFQSEREIPYAPFLGLAAMIVVLFWPQFWQGAIREYLSDPLLMGVVLGGMAFLFTLLLGLIQLIKRIIFR